jgi:ubiquinone/menaquinone biosynthesis C-methylase UbiE
MMPDFNKKIIAQNFAHAAQNYNKNAPIQFLAAKKLSKLTLPLIKNDAQILDLGSGTGFVAENFCHKKGVTIFATDLAFEMLQHNNWCDLQKNKAPENKTRENKVPENKVPENKTWENKVSKNKSNESRVCEDKDSQQKNRPVKAGKNNLAPANIFKIQSDFERLPFKNQSFDLLISSFSLQWLQNFDQAFTNFFALLKTQGILAFCLPTDGSLNELKAADIFQFNELPQIAILRSSLKKSGFIEKKIETEIIKQRFTDGFTALKSLKKIGANYTLNKKKFISKTQLQKFNGFCLKNSDNPDKSFDVSWLNSYLIFSK